MCCCRYFFSCVANAAEVITKNLHHVTFLLSLRAAHEKAPLLLLLCAGVLSLVSTMLEINPRPRMEKELTNRNGYVIKLFKCDLLIFFSVRDLGLISSILDIELYAQTFLIAL